MIYYVLSSCIAMLSLGVNKPTTLKFESAIEYVSLGSEESFNVSISNNKKFLTLKPITAQRDTPLVVMTKKGNFEFQGTTTSKSNYLQFADIRRGEISNRFQSVYSSKKIEVLESHNSLRVINKSKRTLMVNGLRVKGEVDTCKGAPLFVNSKEIVL